jgi:nucleotide-binding universal stress UspA family protein
MDLTDCSRCALHQALRFARRFKAKLTLLYVAETKLAGSEFARNKLAPVESELRQIGRRHLASIKREEIPAGLTCESMVRAGRPDQEILEVAHTTHADLIVVATHSRDSQPGHLGSTAAGVIASAPCPVVVVPVEERGVPFFV